MAKTPTALIGFHDDRGLESVVILFEVYGYQVTTVQTPEEYLKKAKETHYDLYCGDVNL